MYREIFTIFRKGPRVDAFNHYPRALTLWPLVGEGGDDGLHPRPALGVRPHVGEGAAPAQRQLNTV